MQELGLDVDLQVSTIEDKSTPDYDAIYKILEKVNGGQEHRFIWSDISNELKDKILIKDQKKEEQSIGKIIEEKKGENDSDDSAGFDSIDGNPLQNIEYSDSSSSSSEDERGRRVRLGKNKRIRSRSLDKGI